MTKKLTPAEFFTQVTEHLTRIEAEMAGHTTVSAKAANKLLIVAQMLLTVYVKAATERDELLNQHHC